MPHQAPLLELRLALGRRSLTSAAPRAPLGDGALLLAVLLTPAPPQRRQRQVTREPTAAVPHRPRPALTRARQPDRVADHRARPTRRRTARGRAPPDRAAARRTRPRCGSRPAHARTTRSSRCRLERSACSPRSPTPTPRRWSAAISPGSSPRLPAPRPRDSSSRSPNSRSSNRAACWARLRSKCTLALLPSSATSADHQVHVIRPARRLAVPHRHPPALRPRCLAGEPHLAR